MEPTMEPTFMPTNPPTDPWFISPGVYRLIDVPGRDAVDRYYVHSAPRFNSTLLGPMLASVCIEFINIIQAPDPSMYWYGDMFWWGEFTFPKTTAMNFTGAASAWLLLGMVPPESTTL